MKTKKLFSTISACALAAALCGTMAITVAAADWSQASYADNDPNTVKMISQTNTSITFTTTDTNTDICKARITLDKVLENPEDYSKIAKVEWKITYAGVTPDFKGEALSGGTYVTNTNSEGYSIKPDEVDANDNPVWKNDVYTTTDKLDVTAPLEKDGEIVFMDWSFADIGAAGITVTISDFKMFDASGNEIAQLGNNEWAEGIPNDELEDLDENDVSNTSDDLEETTTEIVTQPPVGTEQVTNDNIVANANTGNPGAAIAGAVASLAAVGIILTKKRK